MTFVVPRQAEEGDPLKPSRFLLRTEEESLPARVSRLFAAETGEKRKPGGLPSASSPIFHKTPPVSGTVIESVSVTGFKVFLECPYLFQLRNDRRLLLGDLEERAVELDARAFGTLVHKALELWGREEAAAVRPTVDADEIERSVCANLDRYVAERYPKSRLPAVRVQIELARRRLRRFSRLQAEQAKQGWKVLLAEISFEKEPRDGSFQAPRIPDANGVFLTGRIDRVDVNQETNTYRALDYKTSSDGASPMRTHLRGGKRTQSTGLIEWKDLQLPLYRVLLRSMPKPVCVDAGDLGYFNLAPSAEKSGIAMLDAAVVGDTDLKDAEKLAAEIVSMIRAGSFTPSPRIPVRAGDPFAVIWGRGQRGLAAAGAAEGGDE